MKISMNQALISVCMLFSLSVYGQNHPTRQAQPIVAEGKLLYQSEMASWYGTDLFLEKYKNLDNIGGYFSYPEKDLTKCIFFSASENPEVIGTIAFESTFNTKAATVDLNVRAFTKNENDLYEIRKLALKEINADTLFKTYQGTQLNLIPLISGQERKVYVLTGPEQEGVVIFGNDYLLTFDGQNRLLMKKALHKNIIPIQYGEPEDGAQIEGSMHSHLPETGDFITATDICTLMLYGKFAKWKTHQVISQKYLNTWNCETDELTVIPMEVAEKINKDQKKK